MGEQLDLLTVKNSEMHPDLTSQQISNFRQRLRVMRKQTKITQDALAERLHVVHQDISALERGKKKVTWEIIEAAAEVFGVSPSDMIKSLGPGEDAKSYCLRLLDITQILYTAKLGDYDKQLVEKAIGMLEYVIGV